jgi:hypothetical protein
LLTCSGKIDSDYKKENVLNPDDKCWLSDDTPNSWIQFNFKNRQISPSGYLLKNGTLDEVFQISPQSWKLEGSNDETNWTIISKVQNCDKFRQKNQEATFSCQTDQIISFLRFTQTQENLYKFHYLHSSSSHNFLLNFVEFSGKIISRE